MSLTSSYSTPVRPINLFVLEGHTPTNTYIGRSQAFANVYSQEQAVPGDEIHELSGGTFLVRDGKVVGETRFTLPQKSVLERGPDPETRPDADLAPLGHRTTGLTYRDRDYLSAAALDLDWVRSHATPYGRGPVYVIS